MTTAAQPKKGTSTAKTLQEKLGEMIPKLREERKSLVKEHGNKVISQVTIEQAIGGMRGVKGMVCDTSVVEPDTGLVIRASRYAPDPQLSGDSREYITGCKLFCHYLS